MLKAIDYLKKGEYSLETLEGAQNTKQIDSQIRFKRSGDNLKLPENFRIGQAVADGNCFFDSFRQGLEKQLGIQVTVEQLRHYCRDFAQNNPPEWFINAIANSYDNSGRVRSETLDSYTSDILNSNRWGDPEVEGRILCEKYQVKLHVVEKSSYLLHLQQQVLNNAREFSDNIRLIISNSNSNEELALQLQKDHSEEASSLLVDMTAFDGLDNTHQLISSSGPLSLDNINYNDQHTIHIINRGNAHFEPVLSTQEIRYNRQQSSNRDTPKEERKIPAKEEPKKKSRDSEQQLPGLPADRLKRVDNDPNQAGSSQRSSSDDSKSGRGTIDSAQHKQINPNSPDFIDSDDEREKNTELFSAIKNGNLQRVQELLKEGVKVNIIDKNNKDNTPLHYAVERERKEIVEELLSPRWRTNINLQNNQGNTPLHIATLRGNKELVQLLLNNQAEVSVRNNDNEIPLDIAKKHVTPNGQGIVDILEKSLSKPSSQVETLSKQEKEVNDKLRKFVEDFVSIYEGYFSEYHKRLIEQIPKSGKLASFVNEVIEIGKSGTEGIETAEAKAPSIVGINILQKVISSIGIKHNRGELKKLIDQLYTFKKDPGKVREELIKSGIEIFQNFESQFVQVTADGNWERAMEKLAHDAVNRIINYFKKNTKEGFSTSLITKGIILGKSKRYKSSSTGIPNVHEGHSLSAKSFNNQDFQLTTKEFFEKTGLAIIDSGDYYKKSSSSDKYGFRLLFKWEDSDKEIKNEVLAFKNDDRSYTKLERTPSNKYKYFLTEEKLKEKQKEIFSKLDDQDQALTEERLARILQQVKQDAEKNAKELSKYIEGNFDEVKKFFDEIKQELGEIKQIGKKNLEVAEEDLEVDKKTQAGVENANQGINNLQKGQEVIINEIRTLGKKDQDKKPVWFDVKKPVRLFTGRREELIDLHNKIQRSSEKMTVISQMASISGLGGIGKTELAIQYIHEHSNDYDNNVIWVNAESEEILTESFHRLAQDKLRISTKNADGSEKDIRSIMEEVYKFFNKRKSLFIFDNAEKSEYFNKFLPLRSLAHDANKPYVLITSRNREWEKGIEVMDLNELKLEDAIEFVKKGLSIKDESQDQEIKNLVEELQRFPLAIQQAIAYIEDQRVTGELGINDYLEEYEQKTEDLLNSEVFRGIDNDYAKTTFTTWKITIDKIASDKEHGELALKILDVIAYFAPENINREMFLSLAEGDEEKLKSAVRLLVKYSMTSGVQKQSILSIHRLVQEVTRLSLKEQKKEEKILKEVLELMKISSEISSDHAASAWNYVSKYDKLINKFLKSTYGHSLDTPLHLLAKNGNYEAIKAILKINRSIINAEDNYGRTPLYEAAEKGHIEIVKLLVKNGAKIHVNNASASSWGASGWTVLHGAVYGGNADVVKFLMKEGANICAKDSMGRAPLYIAINEGYEDIIKLLDPTNEMILFVAASLGKLKKVENLLQDKSEEEKRRMTNPEQQRMRGPLHVAANKGYIEIVKLLVENGADINNSADDGYTPLHMAASEGHQDVVEFLVEYVIKKNNKFDILKVSDKSGWTVLHSAAKSGCTEVLKYLIEKFEKNKSVEDLINAADTKGTTLLQTAAFHNKLGTVEFLISKNADINAVDIFGATPLFAASIQNNLDVVKCLLKQEKIRINCDLEKVLGMLNITPLHAAAVYDNLDMTELLVKRSSVNAGKESSLTPLHVAAFFDSSKVIKYLVDNGACTDSEVNFSNIARVLNFVKEDLKEGYGSEFINYIEKSLNLFLKIPLVDNFVLSQFTPRMISTILNHNNQLVHRDVDGKPVRSMRSRLISSLLTLPQIKKQFKMIKDYVQKKKEDKQQPPIGEDSIFYGITNIKPFTQDNKKEQEAVKQGVKVSAKECLPSTSSGRSKREAIGEKCLFTWEDVDEFNEEKDEKRDFDKIKIDSEKFVSYIKDLPKEKQSQLIQLASGVKVTGESQSLVNKLISNQKVMSHLSRVGRISGMTMHGMMAKNVLADFLNGDYQGVAINVGFIAGGQGFAKVAEAASLKGLKLASEGKLLLSSSLRAASPFLARGTSAFVIYDLVNQVKAFKNGTEEALVGIVGDSIYLGVDAAEIGIEIAEAFEVLEGVSSVTGPIGATIGAVVFVGTDIYMAVKRVDKIDEIIHLTGKERFVEGLRAFIGMEPEKHIEELIEEKQLNNQLVKQGLEYLQQHSDIQRYVFPTGKSVVDSCNKVQQSKRVCVSPGFNGCTRARTVTSYTEKCTTKFEEDLDNTVLLDRRRTDIKWSRAKPDNPRGGQLFCLPQGNYEPVPNYGSYLCKSAIGITDLSTNKTGGYTLINLGEGTDHAKGFIDSPNIFVVNNGSKKYHGGNKDDIFILQGSSITGYFYGEGGVNTLDLTSFAPEKESIDVKLHVGQVEDYYQDNSFGMSGINRFLGRKGKADRMFITCDSSTSDIKFVDGQGSSERFVDHIKIDDKDCAYEMQIVVRPNTVVYNRALEGDFHYIVPYALGSAKVDFIYTAEALNLNNTFAFEYEPAQIKNIDVRNINVLNKTSHIITFNFSPMSDKEFNITISGASNPTYRLGNNTEIKVGNRGNLYMLENTNKSVDEIIKDYLVVANRLNKMSFFIQSLLSNETVAIGSGNYEVIHNNPLQKSHLVGNGGENVYVIDYESKRFETPLPEVVIYDLDVESSVDTIDLRNLVQQARGKFSNSFKLQIFKSANDLLLKATVTEVKPTEDLSVNKIIKHEYFTVRLKDGINWYNKTHVIMDNVPMRISLDNNEWSLKPQSLIFEKDKEVIVVTSQDVEENTELITPKRAGNYTFVCDHDSDLIVTNAFDTNVAKNDLCTIVLSKFYEEPKLATLSIKFADKEIVLKDKQKEISTARYVDVVKREHKEQVYNDVFNRSPEVMLSDQPHRHQIRHRRSTSGSARTSSWINDLFGWVKSSIDGLLSSALSKETSSTSSPISQVDAKMDVNGTIMLLDVIVRKFTGKQYIPAVDQSIPLLEARGYALNITNRFEKVLNKTAIKSGISVTNLNFDPVVVQSAIIGKIINGKFSEIAKTLYSFAKEACPEFKQTDKFLDNLKSNLEEVLAKEETMILQQKVEKPSKVLGQEVSRKVQLSKKPDTFLNGTSVIQGISRAIN